MQKSREECEQRAAQDAQDAQADAQDVSFRITISAVRFRGRGDDTDRLFCAAHVTAIPNGSLSDRSDFEITYSIESTEDGQGYVTILSKGH